MRYIDQDKIYEATDGGLDVFKYYFSDVDFNNTKNYFKIRPEEKTASARVTYYDGYWRVTDFGNQNEIRGLKAIDFIIWRENLSFYEAMLFCEQVIIGRTVEGKEFQKIKWAPDYEMREMLPSDKKGAYNFIFKEKPSKEDLAAIGRYVTEDTLDFFYCRSVDKYEYCGTSKKLNRDVVHIFKSNKDYPIFLFDYGTFQKLYRPHEMEKKNRFLYIGEKPKEYIYGLQQILECQNEFLDEEKADLAPPQEKPMAKVRDLFRCAGESDAMNLHSIGFHPYWLNSESSEFHYEQFRQMDELCENHYQIMDLDRTGQAQALRNALKHINQYTIELPPWLAFKKDFRGNPCKDLKDFVNLSGDSVDQTYYNFLVLKNSAGRIKFWHKSLDEKTGKWSYSLNLEDYYFFLKANGFYQIESSYHKNADFCYAWIKGKVVDLIDPDTIKRTVKRFTRDWIKSKNLMDAKHLLNKINTSNQITEANLQSIDEISLNFKNYDRFTEYLNFRNGSLRITRDKIEKVKHEELPNYILGTITVNGKKLSHLIDREIRHISEPAISVQATKEFQVLLDQLAAAKNEEEREQVNSRLATFPEIEKYQVKIHDEDFIYVRFLNDISRIHWRKELEQKQRLTEEEIKEENLALANLMFILGYHCAQYKDPAKAWLTFLQDMKISEVGKSSGRSGKSILSEGPKYVRTTFYKGGRRLDENDEYKFFYDGLTEFHDYLYIDDYAEYAEFSKLYNDITGPREVNPKNYSAITLEYKDSGKMLINSNYELMLNDPSALARLLNAGVSDYYHEKTKQDDYKETRSPMSKFGRRIYEDFTSEEWIRFYNFIAYCIQLTQRFYKIQPPMVNLEKRQLRRIMAQGLGKDESFFKWANEYFVAPPSGDEIKISPPEFGYLNTYIVREDAFKSLKSRLSKKQELDYRSGKFKDHIKAWCDYKGFELNPEEICNSSLKENPRIIKTIGGSSVECFYISTKKYPEGQNLSDLNQENHEDEMPF
ncbi:MAG: hypothetical protein FD166_1430 [Bacteroidetes bacterium]|nr:MAG: hypothetical protein FD166_1430 [Bacteroidota bacterium]